MRVEMVLDSPANHRNVGLRLGGVVEGDRELRPHVIAATERPVQRDPDPEAGGRMTTALRLSEHEAAVEQLDGIVLVEGASLDQRVVFEARQPGCADIREIRGLHASTVARRVPARQRISGYISRALTSD